MNVDEEEIKHISLKADADIPILTKELQSMKILGNNYIVKVEL